MTTANEIKFGVEIECMIPAGNVTFPVGPYHHGREITVTTETGTVTGWKAERDGSIQAAPGWKGVEIVSPILCGAEGLAQVLAILEWLNSLGAKVNRSTGLHITVSYPIWDIKAMKRLIHFTARHEDAIWASTGSKWRQEESIFCRDIKQAYKPMEGMTRREQLTERSWSRYYGLNLTHALRGKPRVEFRYFAGTLNATKMRAYIQMVLGIVERSLVSNSTAKWDGALEGSRAKGCKAGRGRKALAQMLVELRWVARPTGSRPYGWLEDVTTTTECRKIVTKMADKYDITS